MPRPRRPLLYRFNRALAEMYSETAGRPTLAQIVERLGGLVDAELTVLGHRRADQTHLIQWWPQCVELSRYDAAYEHHVANHPVRNRFRTVRQPGPYLLSETVTLARFKQGGLYHDYFRHFSLTRLMAVYAPTGDASHFSLGVSRGGRDFSPEERLVLELAQPHLQPAAQRHLEETDPGSTPGPVGETLTARETEILDWMVLGKTNPEIAVILGLSRWTVKTHVERVLHKLGVENRTAAVAAWRHGR